MTNHTYIEMCINGANLDVKNLGPVRPKGPKSPCCFHLKLHNKPIQLGKTPIVQWWMDRGTLYPKKKDSTSPHFRQILEYFWMRTSREGFFGDPDVAESILLAHLLPHIRPTGGRRVFADAVTNNLSLKKHAGRAAADELQKLLQESRGQVIDIVKFRDQTGDMLGPPHCDKKVVALYREMADELLDEGTQLILLHGGGDEVVAAVTETWERWTTSIGRRSGKGDAKLIMNILSYEARAAFHRCYSALWQDLIHALMARREMDEATARFHNLWHLDRYVPGEKEGMNFHIFHGHIFGLHPAGASFIQTERGRELLEAWITPHTSDQVFGELLFGLSLAVFQYSNSRDQQKLNRPSKNKPLLD